MPKKKIVITENFQHSFYDSLKRNATPINAHDKKPFDFTTIIPNLGNYSSIR